jgi:quinol monooxygenase YgiN
MVRLAVTLQDVGKSGHSLARALRAVARGTRFERGCDSCSVWSDRIDDAVRYEESWHDEAALSDHVKSARFTQLLQIIEAAPHPPDVHVDFVSGQRGLDYIASIREVFTENDSDADET